MFNTLPNLITLFRFFLIPFVIAVFYLDRPVGYFLAGALFILACITDYLDGYVARKLQQTSLIGQFLDPLADKLLVASVLIMLVGFGRIPPLFTGARYYYPMPRNSCFRIAGNFGQFAKAITSDTTGKMEKRGFK